jgi:ribosomal-protein-alanine N-acetyltransferase
LRADPVARLGGARVMVVDPPNAPRRRVVGSIVFHGKPGADGVAEIAYGVEEASQRRGFATEAVTACVDWALSEDGVQAVQATTFEWHHPSLRVMTNVGMLRAGVRDHETLGEMLVFERRRAP